MFDVGQDLIAVDPAQPTKWIDVGLASGWVDGWSADGSRLLSLSNSFKSGTGPSFYILSENGSQMPLTTNPPAGWGSLSPDGTTVAYGSLPYWRKRGGGLNLISANGGSSRLLVAMTDAVPSAPAWSPDGSRIAFFNYGRSKPNPVLNISLIKADGTDQRVLVDLRARKFVNISGLVWSTNSSRLAFSVGSPAKHDQIWIIDADGRGLRQITHGDDNFSPPWSPDSSRIAFVHGGQVRVVFTVALDGSDLRPIGHITPNGPITWNPVP